MNLKLSGIFKSPGMRNTSILVKIAITGFILIFTLNASLGIYSIFKISDNLKKSTETLNTARKTELKLQEQVLTWQNLLMEGENFERYKNHYHMFSYNAQDVQNLLFNLKLQLSDAPLIKDKIEDLRILHREITSEFTGHIVDQESFIKLLIRGKVLIIKKFLQPVLTVRMKTSSHTVEGLPLQPKFLTK